MEQAIDLNQYRPQRHPLADVFKDAGISQPILANFLGVSVARVQQMFSGTTGMPSEHERKLKELAKAVKDGRVKK